MCTVGSSPRCAIRASFSASSRSVLRLTLVHRHASWQGLATATGNPSAVATSWTQPHTSHVSNTTSTAAASAGVRACDASRSWTAAGVVASDWNRWPPPAGSNRQATLLNLPRSTAMIC